MKQIVCFSTTPWHEHFTRKQQVMSRLPDCEILYINPPVTMIARFKDKKAAQYLELSSAPPTKPMPNVTVYTPPAVLPFYNKKRSINKYNQKHIMLPFVKRAISDMGFDKPVLWVYHPSYADIVGHIPNSGIVYDCIDRHSAYQGFITPAVVDKMEEDLCKSCRAVFATASGLYNTLSKHCQNIALIPNGANYELFSRALDNSLPCPDELQKLSRPIFGFVGALQECIDYDCLEAVAKRSGSLVLIGPQIAGVDLSRFEKYGNVHILGAREQKKLPEYIRQFDVCLNPFRAGRLSQDVSPLKFYEYLATGKPVISTKQPLQVNDFADIVGIANDTEQFSDMAASFAEGLSNDKRELQLKRARECSWDSRIAQMRSILAELGLLL